jgi:ATP-dependent helicase/DNAse subunit B
VLCLRLEDARHIEARYVYCLGVNEGVVPSAPPVSAIYSEADYGDLRKAGLDLDMTRTHGLKERLLFLRLFSVATEHLTLSWHESTQQGKAIYRSPFVQDICDLGDDYGLPLRFESETGLWPMNVREAVSAGMAGKAVLLPELTEAVGKARDRAGLERSRYAISTFNEFDGVLNEPGIVEEIAGYYDIRHRFSANQIETYIDCPFRFMMNNVLEIPSLDTPNRGLDAKDIGTIYHNVLEQFYKKYRGVSLENVNLDEVLGAVEELTDVEFTREVGEFAKAYPGIAGVERSRIGETLLRHVRLDRESGSEGLLPKHFEVKFGEFLTEHSDSLSMAETFSLDLGGEEYQFTGRIDRVDLNADGTEAMIVDYKSSLSNIAKKDITEGRNIQLTLYAMALELLLPEADCVETRYLKIGTVEKYGTVDKTKSEAWANARVTLESSIRDIQAGVFHPKADEKVCRYCPSNKVCRFEEGRIAGKTAP